MSNFKKTKVKSEASQQLESKLQNDITSFQATNPQDVNALFQCHAKSLN